jgi:hypothetical protein
LTILCEDGNRVVVPMHRPEEHSSPLAFRLGHSTGVQFVPGWFNYFFVARSTMRQMVCQTPSVFELLPPSGHDWGQGVPEPGCGALPSHRSCFFSLYLSLPLQLLLIDQLVVGVSLVMMDGETATPATTNATSTTHYAATNIVFDTPIPQPSH